MAPAVTTENLSTNGTTSKALTKGSTTMAQVNGHTNPKAVRAIIDPPTDPNTLWWWDRCAPLLASLLSSCGAYSQAQMEEHMRVFRDAVCPSFGLPTPQAKITPLLTMDGSPLEASWNFCQGENIVRYAFEPLGNEAGTESDLFACKVVPTLLPLLRYISSDVDLRWFEQITQQWFVEGEDAKIAKQRLPPHVDRIPQIFLAYDMKKDKRMLKAYLFPVLKHFVTGRTTEDLTFSMIRNLQPGGDRLKAAADKLESYLASSKEPIPVEMIAIDCVDPSQARVKVYARTKSNSLATVRDAFTLGGVQTDSITMDGVSCVSKIWHLLLDERGGMPSETYNKPARDQHTIHQGVCFVFELRQGADRIDVKAHIPWSQTSESDLRTMGNFTEALGSVGWKDGAAVFAKGAVETALIPGRDYSKAGGLSYTAFNYGARGPYMSAYLSAMAQDY